MTLVPWNLRQQMKMGFVLTFNNFYVGMKTQMILHLQPSVRGPVPLVHRKLSSKTSAFNMSHVSFELHKSCKT